MKQQIQPYREQCRPDLAPEYIDFELLGEQYLPTQTRPEDNQRVQMIRHEYAMQQQIRQREQSQVSRQSFAVTAVKLGALATGGALIWQIATAFNPAALAITAGIVGVVGVLTYPGKRQEDQPTWMPKSDAPVASKQSTVNVNPVVNIAVNVQQ